MQIVTPEKNCRGHVADTAATLFFSELDYMVRRGLPKSALRVSVDHVGRNTEERTALLYRIIAEATYKRRRDRLTPDESEKKPSASRACSPLLSMSGTLKLTPGNSCIHPTLS
ncbi:antitoxin Xre-like helix-turn-helix domain-containing protein [Undibacterium arcticum]